MLLLPSILVVCLLTNTTFADFTGIGDSGWHGVSNYGATSYGSVGNDINAHQHPSSYGSFSSYGSDFHIDDGFDNEGVEHTITQPMAISEHIEVTKPVAVPVVKNIGIPVAQPVAIPVPHPVAIPVAQLYPVHVPIARPIAVPVVRTVAVPVEKKVPYPVEKIIPVPVEKAVPITVEKYIPVPIEKPYPIHIPVYKHVFYRKSKSRGNGYHSGTHRRKCCDD